MNDERLTGVCRVMDWKVTPDRFIKINRSWIPRWRFTHLDQLVHAKTVIEQTAADLGCPVARVG